MQKRMWYVTDTCMRRVFPEFHHKSIKHLWNGIDMELMGRWWEHDATEVPCPQPSLLAFWDRLVSLRSCCFTACGHDFTFSGSCKTTALQGSWDQLRKHVSWWHDVSHDVIMMSGGMSMAWSKHLRILDWWILGWVCVGSCSVGHAKQDLRRNIFRYFQGLL